MLQEAMDQVSVLDGDWVVRRMLGVGLVNPALSPSHLNTHPGRATSERLWLSPPPTSGAKAWRSTTRGRWRRIRSAARGATLRVSGRSGLPAGSPPASPGGLMTLSPSRPPFDLKLFALCSQYHGLDQICNKKMHSKINNFRHRESKSVRIYKGGGAFQTKFFFSETLA